METTGFIIGVLPLLQQIKTTVDNVKALPQACKRLQNDVDVFITILETHNDKIQQQTSPSCLPSLETALFDALETAQVCVKTPFKAKLKASYYNNKIDEAHANIRNVLEQMTFHGVLSIDEQGESIQRLSDNMHEIGDGIASDIRDTQDLIQQVMIALKDRQENKLLKIAKNHGLHNVQALQKEILEYKQELKNMKDSVEEQDIETAKMLSTLAIEVYATCPDAYKCPITHDIMVNPVMLVNSGHTYDSTALYSALSHKPNVDPLTNKVFEGAPHLQANFSLKKAITEWIEKQESLIMNSPPDDSTTYTTSSLVSHEITVETGKILDRSVVPTPEQTLCGLMINRKFVTWVVFLFTIGIVIVATVLTSISSPALNSRSNPTSRPSVSRNPTQRISSSPALNSSSNPTSRSSISRNPTQRISSSPALNSSSNPTSRPSIIQNSTQTISASPALNSSSNPTSRPSIIQNSTQTISSSPAMNPSSNPTSRPRIIQNSTQRISSSPAINPNSNSLFLSFKTIPPPKDEFFSSSTVLDISKSFIIIGNSRADNTKGELYVYDIDGSYLRTIRPYDGNEGDGFASSLSIHNELIVVGSPERTRGKAYMYHVSGDLFAELAPPDSRDGDKFGWSVGISDTHVVIGAPGRGKAFIYVTALHSFDISLMLAPTDLDAWGSFAFSLSLSENLIVFGAPNQDSFRGVAYVYNTRARQMAKLEASDGQYGDYFGRSVAIDGDTIAVGAPWYDDKKGAMYIYDGSGNEINKVMDPTGEKDDLFGLQVDVSNNHIAVRTKNYVFICNETGKILAKRDAFDYGDVTLTDGKLLVYDNIKARVISMEHQI